MEGILKVIFMSLLAAKISAGVFLHEPSLISIHPRVHLNHSDFGFAMGFQSSKNINNLIVGAPSVDLNGKIYTCDMNNSSYQEEITCQERNVTAWGKSVRRKEVASQHFYLGASIAATTDYFFSCAPLWTTYRQENAVGTCFIFDQTDRVTKYKGTYEQYYRMKLNGNVFTKNTNSFLGGTGWSNLIDEDNGLLIIIKTSLEGDIVYTPIHKPLDNTKSMILGKTKLAQLPFHVENFFNFGFGATSGKFFSNKTVYAFSMTTKIMGGIIEFLEYNSTSQTLSIINQKVQNKKYTILSEAVGTMFGSVLAAADLNMDGLTELLVGAPVHSEEDCTECGALHIYMGGEMETINDRNRLRLTGVKNFGRFSTSIAAKDIDGDSIPELVVGAPYEDDGLGAVYIISGYEIYDKLRMADHLQLQVSKLKSMQRIQKKEFHNLGFSLQFIPDADNNGCSELVAGSPGTGTAVLFKSIQNINVTLTSTLLGNQIVREQDTNFIIKVCANVEYPEKPYEIQANLTVMSSIIGDGANIKNPTFERAISCINCSRTNSFCDDFIVQLNDKEPRDYTFKSEAIIHTDHIFKSSVFKNYWVVTSPYSQLNKAIEVFRHCSGDDCIPHLSMELSWSGGKGEPYVLGSSALETATILVRNNGSSSYGACVWVQVLGAPWSQIDCAGLNNIYTCYLRKPLRRDEEQPIKVLLKMAKPTNADEQLKIVARLYENCANESMFETQNFTIRYVIPTEKIYVNGISHSRNVTDKEILDDEASIFDDQEYLITNNGSITWKNIVAKISMKKKPFIKTFTVLADKRECVESHTDDIFSLSCTINLDSNSTQKIIATTEILKTDINNNLVDKKLQTTSQLELELKPTGEIKNISLTTVMTFEKELTFANDIWLIALIAILIAICILIVIVAVLYKIGFFKRKQKQRLHVLRESIKQRNSRRNTHISSVADGQGIDSLQMDVDDDDNAFETVPKPHSTNDDIIITEENAQVHC